MLTHTYLRTKPQLIRWPLNSFTLCICKNLCKTPRNIESDIKNAFVLRYLAMSNISLAKGLDIRFKYTERNSIFQLRI